MNSAFAASLPGPADAGRVDQRESVQVPAPVLLNPSGPMDVLPVMGAPEGSKQVTVTLNDIRITGMSVFRTKDVKDIYASYLGRRITLDTIWLIAGQLTERYRNKGYFLSQVFVPQQEIKDGVVILRVVEGYIGDIQLNDKMADNHIVRQWTNKLLSYRPIKANQLESILLHLNDLPGVSLHAVLEPMQTVESTEGAVRLVLEPKAQARYSGSIGFDNYSSRFLGPYEGQMRLEAFLLPLQKTTVTLLSSLPWDEMKYGGINHEMPLFAGATLELYGSYTHAAPGYTLTPEDIRSVSAIVGTAVDYSIIRQRQENLTGRVAIEGQDTHSDILGTALTRDSIRAMRMELNYELADMWDGENSVDAIVSQGLNVFGASQTDQPNISHAGATPNFTKVDLSVSRLQTVTPEWSFLTALSTQLASGPLYTSEQFGYGGQAFGRAYDNSEITGDQGVNGSTELRFNGLPALAHLQSVPYGYYDLGAVWSTGPDQTLPYASGSSLGAGIRLTSDLGFSSNLGFGVPLTRPASNPLYGNGKSPRYFMQVGYVF